MTELLLNDRLIQPYLFKILNFDRSLFVHCYNVSLISEFLLERLGYKDETIIKEVLKGALIHDIGKIYVPRALLFKPSFLTNDEMNVIKNHPAYGYEHVKDSGASDIVLDIILSHHETENGRGYPNKATMMQEETQIVSIADKYEAMTSKRPYKAPMKHNEVMNIIKKDCDAITMGDRIYKELDYFDYDILRVLSKDAG
jgi:putative nucleotidyltransferase with HDIG domain